MQSDHTVEELRLLSAVESERQSSPQWLRLLPGVLQPVAAQFCAALRGNRRAVLVLMLLVLIGEGIFVLAAHASRANSTPATLFPAFLAAFFLSTIFTALTRDFALRRSMVDAARSVRKVHVKAVPRLGGVAFVLAWYVSIGMMLALDARLRQVVVDKSPRSYVFLAGGLLIALVGAADDLWGLRARHKLLAQLVVSFALCASGLSIRAIELPMGGVVQLGWLSYPISMLWTVGVMNALNLIDGLDGLAGGVSEIALGAVLVMSMMVSLPALSMYSAALSGAVLGFLVYNFNPASIFMGDAGSLFLGYFLAVALAVGAKHPATGALPMAVPLLVLGVPVADTLLAMGRRALRGKGLFSPDKEHLHHQLLGRGLSHLRAVLVLYAACFVLALAGLGIAFGPRSIDAVIWVALAVGLAAVLWHFGVFKLSLEKLLHERRRNLELRAAISEIASRLQEAKELSDVSDSLSVLVPAVSADEVAIFHAEAPLQPAPPEDVVHMRFPLGSGRRELGYVQVVWGDGRPNVEPDHALAIEELCDHVSRAVKRLSPEPESARSGQDPREQRKVVGS
jgi:UDP-GlcNAc:undecaprenyl-phosphate GlcNAc-1-phosphate transferase